MRKKKTMKKIVSAMMALLMTIALFVPTYADVDTISVADMRNYLIQAGVSEEFLRYESEEGIYSLYDEIHNQGGILGECTSVTETMETMTEEVMPLATQIPSSDLTLRCTTVKYYKDNGDLAQVIVHSNYSWAKGDPFYRLKSDGITINWDSNYYAYKADSFYYQGTWYNPLTHTGGVYATTTRTNEIAQGGLGFTFELNRDTNLELSGSMKFTLLPKTSSVTTTHIAVKYAHANSPLSGVSIVIKGIGIDFGNSGYSEASVAATLTA